MKIINNTACSQYLRTCNRMDSSGSLIQSDRNFHRLFQLFVLLFILFLCSMSPIRLDCRFLQLSRTSLSIFRHMNQNPDKFLV